MPVHDSLLDVVGGTPLVRLRHVPPGTTARVLVELEYLDPGGSVKDRAATAMVAAAEGSGALQPGGTIVEGTSGNTGIGLAQAAAVRGHRLVVVVPDSIAVEKIDALRAYGAEVVRTRPDDGTVTHLVACIDTGGTISGTGAHLEEVSGGRVTVVGADPATSVFGGGDGSPHFVEAAGRYRHPDTASDVWPRSYHPAVLDRVETVTDRETLTTTRRLALDEGLLVGASSGLAAAAARRVARGLGPEHTVVAVLPDSGRAYLSKYHSPTWLRRTGFLDDDRPGLLAGILADAGVTAGGVHTVTSRTPLAEAVALAAGPARDRPLLPVVLPRPGPAPAPAMSEVVGALDPALLADQLARHGAGTPAGDVAGPPPPSLGTGETVEEALARLDEDGRSCAAVLRDGRLAGVVSRADLVRALATGGGAMSPG